MSTPLLFISDHPGASTGLGRICRELALRVHEHCADIFRVATLGYGSPGSRTLPFPQYYMTEVREWVVPDLPETWFDFAGEEPGVVFTIWDASRLLWFAKPEPRYCDDPKLRQFLQTTRFQRWGYFPIDAEGPHHAQSVMIRECLSGFKRVLAYSSWAERLMRNTLGDEESERRELTSLPHGIDTSVFRPAHPVNCRKVFHEALNFQGPNIRPEEKIIGIVATNQARKDFGLAFQAIAEFAKSGVPFRLFIQTDKIERFWSIPALILDYGLAANAMVSTGVIPDAAMSMIYSACDLTLGIGSGEGFGYPIFESLACGTPVLTCNYGGHAEHLSSDMLMEPEMYRMEGLYNCVRPVFDPKKMAYRIGKMLKQRKTGESLLPPAINWDELWPRWEAWWREGHRNFRHLEAAAPESSSSTSGTDRETADHGRSLVAFPANALSCEDAPVDALTESES